MENQYTVITGASSGIGYETARVFAGRGKNLILVARRTERMEKLKEEISSQNPALDIVLKPCDLSQTEKVYALYNSLRDYRIETWVNSAGFGNYGSVAAQDMEHIEAMLNINIEALTILSSLYVRDYKGVSGTQLINISSRGGYMIVPNAITYCATKFYVSAFTEGLAHELKETDAKMQAKVLAPAATKTEFGMIANHVSDYDYDKSFGSYHTSAQVADFLLKLYDSDKTVGIINFETFQFDLRETLFNYAGSSAHNQKV